MMAQAPILPQAQPQASAEMKTMMGTAPPILPPPTAPAGATAEQRTMMAQAPVLPAPQKTQAAVLSVPAPKPGNSTVVLGEQAPAMPASAPRAVALPPQPKGPGALFWMTWLFLGVGLGMAAHFVILPRVLGH